MATPAPQLAPRSWTLPLRLATVIFMRDRCRIPLFVRIGIPCVALLMSLPHEASSQARSASAHEGKAWHWFTSESGVALDGYDPVAYFKESRARRGSSRHTATYRGLTYHFASAAHRLAFVRQPARYLPQFGGWCALAAGADKAQQGFAALRYPPDPQSFEIRKGKLYLFAKLPNFDAKALFSRSKPSQVLARAKTFWAEREALAKDLGDLPPGMNPRAPMETAQFGFFIGRWKSTAKWMNDTEKRTYTPEVEAVWTARWGWHGFAIYDDWEVKGRPMQSGPALRTFDPGTRTWTMVYFPVLASRDSVWLMQGKFDKNGDLVANFTAKDPRGREFLQRVRFHRVSRDHLRWTADRTYDGGKTWIKDIAVSDNIRLAE